MQKCVCTTIEMCFKPEECAHICIRRKYLRYMIKCVYSLPSQRCDERKTQRTERTEWMRPLYIHISKGRAHIAYNIRCSRVPRTIIAYTLSLYFSRFSSYLYFNLIFRAQLYFANTLVGLASRSKQCVLCVSQQNIYIFLIISFWQPGFVVVTLCFFALFFHSLGVLRTFAINVIITIWHE